MEKKKQRLLIVGGGSTYTVGFVVSLLAEAENFPLESIKLFDIDEKRQEAVGKTVAVILKERAPHIQFSYTTNKEEAYKDVDFAFLQIRSGGLEMRIQDEKIPLSHGCVGQETCGSGGMSYGMRSIGDMIDIINDLRKYSPDAWILNYTNPAAIVAEALKRVFPDDKKILNICDMPAAMMVSYADIIGKEVFDLVPEYFGLNHFGWFTKIYDKEGNDYTDIIKNKIITGEFLPKDSEMLLDPTWAKTFKMAKKMLTDFPDYLPNTYLQYYLYPQEVVEHSDVNDTRASQVIRGRQKRVTELYQRVIEKNSTEGEHLETDIHGRYMIRVAASLAYNNCETYIVIVKNNGIISNLPADAMVEVPAMLTKNGPKAFAIGEIPTFQKGLIENQYAYEKLVVDAYLEKSYLKALQALTLNRTVVNAPVAKRILDDMLEANNDFFSLKK